VSGVITIGVASDGAKVEITKDVFVGVTTCGVSIAGAYRVVVSVDVLVVTTNGVASNASKVVSVNDLVAGVSVCGVIGVGEKVASVNAADSGYANVKLVAETVGANVVSAVDAVAGTDI
jgi:hypothetical protein